MRSGAFFLFLLVAVGGGGLKEEEDGISGIDGNYRVNGSYVNSRNLLGKIILYHKYI